jgi:TonB-linked SusC/RagA family outer membrane protein
MIMKLIAILLTFFCIQLSANGFSQRISLSEKEAPFEKVINEISKQSGYNVFYTQSVLQYSKKITVEINNVSLKEALDICFKEQPLIYSITGKTIIVKQKENPAKDLEQINVTPIDVKGKVLNEKGEAVIGVSIKVKGTDKGTITDENGEFTLRAIDANSILIISGVAIETVEWKLKGQSEVLIATKIRITTEEEIIINTGYQKLKPNEVTGSVEKIGNKLYNRAISTDFISRLEGITSGLYVSKVQVTEYTIRGLSTLHASRNPLIVLDNFPYNGDIKNINPNDIENITILKDAAAASIWGSKAGNGVIVITTKKGQYNKSFTASINSNLTIQRKPDVFYNRDFISSNDFIDVEQQLFAQGFYDSYFQTPNYNTISPVVELLDKVRNGVISQSQADEQINALRKIDVRKDYEKYIYQNRVAQQYSIDFSGGAHNSNYFVSAGFDKDRSLSIGDEFSRKDFRSFFNFKPLQKLEFQVGLTYTLTNQKINSIGKINPSGYHTTLYPYAQLADASGNALSVTKDYSLTYVDTAGAGLLLDWKYRPLDELKFSDNQSRFQDVVANFGINYKILKNLTADIKYRYEQQDEDGEYYYSPQTYYTRNLINLYSEINGTTVMRHIPLGGILIENDASTTSNSIRGQLNYSNQWKKNMITTLAGGEVNEVHTTGRQNQVYGYDKNNLTFKNVDYVSSFMLYGNYGADVVPNGTNFLDRTNRATSAYGNMAYTYDKRYVLTASARKDASNFFGVKTNRRVVPLWSSGFKWNISNEKFYHSSFFPQLSLRISYGYNGNINNLLSALTTISYSSSGASVTNLPYAIVSSLPNDHLRWERVKIINTAVDFQSKNNSVSGSVEYYIKKGIDLLAPVPADLTLGITSLTMNTANISGKGIDASLDFKILDGKFKWTSSFLFHYVSTKVTHYLLKKSSDAGYVGFGYTITPAEGKDPYALISYRFAGLDPLTGDPMGFINGSKSSDYQTLIVNPTWNDLVISGSTRPPYFGSLLNTVEWNGFSLSANIVYKFKYYFRRNSINYYNFFNTWMGNKDFYDRWQKPGDERNTNIPSMVFPSNIYRDQFYNLSEAVVEKGDLIRLKDISFSYTAKKIHFGNYNLKGAVFYTYLNNIGLLWKANKHNIDPDYGLNNWPDRFSISVGLKTDF